MKKTVIILSVFALIASSCGQATSKQTTNNAIEINQENEVSATDNQEKEQKKLTQKEYFLDEIKVLIKQQKSNGIDFYCKAKITVTKNEKLLDSISFSPEPVGGSYGISNAIKLNNHLIFTKHGDYDGRTIIVNNDGKIFNIIGGENYVDVESNLLFTIYESDVSGFAIFDLKSDSVLLTENEVYERPISIHKIENKYFMICESDETGEKSFWEFDFEMNKINKSVFDKETINASNELQILLTMVF